MDGGAHDRRPFISAERHRRRSAITASVLAIELPNARSGERGAISVGLDAAAKSAGAGTLTLDFQPLPKGAFDPAIQLGVVGRSLPFTIAAGDAAVRFRDLTAVAFQTGTTAGTIAIAVELGGRDGPENHRHPAVVREHSVSAGRQGHGRNRPAGDWVR